jgi:protein-S-isoprenylcysteine O-methyltransferase Ste14
MVVALKILLIVQLVAFRVIYRSQIFWKDKKSKSEKDVGWLKNLLLPMQLGIFVVVAWAMKSEISFALLATGNFISFCGLSLIFWAKKTLGENFSECVDMYTPHSIVTVGPYKTIRHPIYTGNMVFLSGLAIACSSIVLIAITVFFVIFYVKSASIEEQELQLKYPDYQKHMEVTGRFLPKILKDKK